MRLTKEAKEAKRNAIINVGSQLMTKQGYAGTGVSEIAKEVGMPKGSFFNYFKSKEDFTIQMLEYYCEHSLNHMKQKLRDATYSPIERLKKYYTANVQWHQNTKHYKGGCLLNGLSTEVSDYNDTISQAVKSCYDRLIDEIALCLQQAQEAGELSTKHDVLELATFIDNNWRGYLTTSKAARNELAAQAFLKYTFEYLLI